MSLVTRIKIRLNAPDLQEHLKLKGKIMSENETIQEPGLLSKGFRLAREYTKWKKAGSPVRSEKSILHIFNTYCKPCEYFGVDHCIRCGCKINTTTGLNKILWATTSCPIEDNPKWTSDIDVEVTNEEVEVNVAEGQILSVEEPTEEAPPPVVPAKNPCGCGG